MNAKPRTSRVTVASVARKAGVSTTTVSLILSDREEYLRQFAADTIQKVRDTARRLGYHGNLFASGLPTRGSQFFALVVREEGNEEISNWHQWSFEGDLLAGIIRAAGESRVYPIVATAGAKLDESSMRPLERVIAGGVFGAIVRTPHPLMDRYLHGRIRHGQPIVVVFPQKLRKWPTNAIDVDNRELGATAARLLAAHGRRSCALVHYRAIRDTHALRIEGFNRAAAELGLTVQSIQMPMGVDDLRARDFIAARLKRMRIDGLFSLDSVSSVGALLACLKTGMRVGEDFHQVGCDCSMWQSPPLPRITSVDISWKEVGMTAVSRLLALAGGTDPTFPTLLLPPRVVWADTCPQPGATSLLDAPARE